MQPPAGDLTPYEQTHVIRHMDPESEARMHELAARHNDGLLTRAERREYHRLLELASALMVENARALLRHRDPAAYAAALEEERRLMGKRQVSVHHRPHPNRPRHRPGTAAE